MRIALVIESLRMGGAERVMSVLAEALARRGHAVSLITFLPPERDFFTVPPEVARIYLSDPRWSGRDLLSMLIRNLRRIWRVRQALVAGRIQAAISFMEDSNALTALS